MSGKIVTAATVLTFAWLLVEYRHKSVPVMPKSPAVFLRKRFNLPLAFSAVFRPDAAQLWLVHGA